MFLKLGKISFSSYGNYSKRLGQIVKPTESVPGVFAKKVIDSFEAIKSVRGHDTLRCISCDYTLMKTQMTAVITHLIRCNKNVVISCPCCVYVFRISGTIKNAFTPLKKHMRKTECGEKFLEEFEVIRAEFSFLQNNL